MTVSTDESTRVRLSAQRALLGAISAPIRAVVVNIHGSGIRVTAYFDGEPAEEDADALSCVEAEIMADFPAHEVAVRSVRQDAPQVIYDAGYWVYQRRE